jgi:4-amino-4-deoxy-L-arabinose transferase-like glycosyltransferase
MEKVYINASVALFSICAQVIMFLFVFFLRKERNEKPLIKNGIPAVATIVLLLIYLFRQHIQQVESMVLFTLATSAALVLIAKDQEELPKWLDAVHGILFTCGFIFLLFFTYTHH